MKRLWAAVIMVAIAHGCGTIGTISQAKPGENLIYSGTRAETASGWAFSHTLPDLPFTIVGDTLALPYTVPHAFWQKSPSTQPKSDSEN
jgi:uncharacterized protein YceK